MRKINQINSLLAERSTKNSKRGYEIFEYNTEFCHVKYLYKNMNIGKKTYHIDEGFQKELIIKISNSR